MSDRTPGCYGRSARIVVIYCTWSVMIALAVVLGWSHTAGAGILDSLKEQLASVRESYHEVGDPAPIDSLTDDGAREATGRPDTGDPIAENFGVGDGPDFDDGDYAKVPNSADPTNKALDGLFDGGKKLPMIPEPGTLVLLALALLTIYLWRRKW